MNKVIGIRSENLHDVYGGWVLEAALTGLGIRPVALNGVTLRVMKIREDSHDEGRQFRMRLFLLSDRVLGNS
jgi:hypothetical protein